MGYHTIITGAGAAGLMAANTASKKGSVLVLEKMERPGRKLRITGKGRCNITNMRSGDEFLAHLGTGREFFAGPLSVFGSAQAREFFEQMGVETVVERGERLFPASGRAGDVADALERACRKNGVEFRFHSPVARILTTAGRVSGVELESGERIECRNVILATGGMTYPATGSTGDGLRMARELGHKIAPLLPVQTPLESSLPGIAGMHGLLLKNISVELYIDGKAADKEFGELQFVDFSLGRDALSKGTARRVAKPGAKACCGVAGATALRLSRGAVVALSQGRKALLAVDLKPALSVEKLTARIGRETGALGNGASLGEVLRKLLPREIAFWMASRMGGMKVPMRNADPGKLAAQLKRMEIPLSGYRPFSEAVITAGGVDLSQIDPASMRSKLVPGLYLAGELLDLDADTGGYNLQIAFTTGYVAGLLL